MKVGPLNEESVLGLAGDGEHTAVIEPRRAPECRQQHCDFHDFVFSFWLALDTFSFARCLATRRRPPAPLAITQTGICPQIGCQ